MADQDVIIQIGSSNMAGFLANLYDVPAADYLRWLSQAVPTPSTPARPYQASIPGVRMWTPRRPYSLNSQRAITVIGGGNTIITYGGTAISAPTVTADMWLFVLRGTGRGNLRKITAVAGQDLTVTPALSPVPVANDTVVVLQDSHTLSTIDTIGGVASLGITKTATSPAFTSAVVGRFASFFDSASGGETTRKIVAQTATTLTFDQPLTALPAAGTGFCVLTGANSCEGASSMQPPNAVLQPLTFALDEVSPVYLTGLEYPNWDFTPWASPRALSFDPTVNSTAELSYHVRSKTGRPLVILELGVSASMVSPFAISVGATCTLVGPLHDITNLDYHPSSPAGIYPLLVNAITSMRSLIAAEGNVMKVRGIFINLFDNDDQDTQRTYRIGANTVLLRDTLRTLLGDQTIPWIMSGPSAYGGGPDNPSNTSVYRQLFQIAADDPHSGVVDTRVGFTYAEDNAHLSAASQIRLGQEFFRVWEPIIDDLQGKPPVVDISICNRALTVIGESPTITSIDPPLGSAHAPLCKLLYPEAVRIVSDSRHWTFRDRRVALSKVQLQSPVADVTLNTITTATPHGFAIGSPLSFTLAANGTGSLPAPLVANQVYYVASVISPYQFTITATVGGYGTVVDLTSVGSIGGLGGQGAWRAWKESDRDGFAFMYALPVDCLTERNLVPAGAPDDWPGMDGALLGTPYSGIGMVSTSRNGLNFSSDATGFGEVRRIPCKRAINRSGEQVIYTDLDAAELVYSRAVDDTTQWPPLYQEAVVFQLAAGLAGAIKRDPQLVDWCLGKAQAFISEAARVDSERVVERNQQRYPWSR